MRSEFDFIHNIKNKYSLNKVGDDCAVLPKDDKTDLLVTADMLVEDIDFRLDWTTPDFLGRKSLTVSLSDIAAMGGQPTWSMLSVGVPERIWNTTFLDDFYSGYMRIAGKFKVELVGGDISRTPDKLVIDCIVGGVVEKGEAILRGGAKPGDLIFVTGLLGGAAGGIMLLENGVRYRKENRIWEKKLLSKQLVPYFYGFDGRLAGIKDAITSMIDLSDGISSDLGHICQSSSVGASLNADKIPIEKKLKGLKLSSDDLISLALNGGEDYQLLFTADRKKISALQTDWFYEIGEINANVGTIELRKDNSVTILEPKGFRHF